MAVTIAVVTDLIFSTKITGTAKALGRQVVVARSIEKLSGLLDGADTAGTQPVQVIIDLNVAGLDPLAAIRVAKSRSSNPRVIAFLSHVQADLAAAAKRAGADQVLARSAFSERLPEILGGLG